MEENIICKCKYISEKEIIDAIKKHQATTIELIQIKTFASTGCGRCKPAVKYILERELSK